jgi:hypothetical protein
LKLTGVGWQVYVATGYNINFVLFVFFKVDLTLPGQLYHPELLDEERYVFISLFSTAYHSL